MVRNLALRDFLLLSCWAFAMAVAGALSNAVIWWMVGGPLAFGAAVALAAHLLDMSKRKDLYSPLYGRWTHRAGVVLMLGGLFALAVSTVFTSWPLQGDPIPEPVPFDWAVLGHLSRLGLVEAALAALGFHAKADARWGRSILAYAVLASVIPAKLVTWQVLYSLGLIVLRA